MTASSRPVATLATVTRITLKVVSLMPPPVPPGGADEHQNAHHAFCDGAHARQIHRVKARRAGADRLEQAVYQLVAHAHAPPRVTGLYHSKRKAQGTAHNEQRAVQNKTTLVCRVRCFVRRHCARSCQTKKPSLPAMIRHMITACTYQLAV